VVAASAHGPTQPVLAGFCRREKVVALTKNELAQAISDLGAGGRTQVKNMLDALAEVVQEEVFNGENVAIPGVVNIRFRYVSPRKKGELYKKGDTYVGFGGVEQVAETDSKARKQSVVFAAKPVTALNKIGKDEAVMKKAIKKAKK
jgi:nucleoid DNA-binding protein